MQTKTFTRKEFYELLWQNPKSLLIQQYETTFTELKDICTNHNIPGPGSGYWSKLRSGLTALKTPLPEMEEEPTIQLVVKDSSIPDQPKTKPSTLQQKIEEIENTPGIIYKVPKKLTNPDPIITSIMNEEQTNPWLRRKTGNELLEFHSIPFNVKVSRNNYKRLLLLLDTFIKMIKFRGYEIEDGWKETYIKIDQEKVCVKLFERSKWDDNPGGSRYDYRKLVPTGKLKFNIGKQYHIREYVDGPLLLEERLAEFLARIELIAEQEKIERIRREAYWKEQDEIRKKKKPFRPEKIRKSNQPMNYLNVLIAGIK